MTTGSGFEKEVQLDQLMPLILEKLKEGKQVKFSPRGISMLPLIRQGVDSVVFSMPPEKMKKYDLPLYQRDNGAYVLHRIVKAGDTYTCIGDNQFVLERGVRPDQMIAIVTAVIRKGRTISVESFGYKLYCRFWHFSRPVRHFCRRCINRLTRGRRNRTKITEGQTE